MRKVKGTGKFSNFTYGYTESGEELPVARVIGSSFQDPDWHREEKEEEKENDLERTEGDSRKD